MAVFGLLRSLKDFNQFCNTLNRLFWGTEIDDVDILISVYSNYYLGQLWKINLKDWINIQIFILYIGIIIGNTASSISHMDCNRLVITPTCGG